MGGNALKNCTTRRYEKDEYFALENEVIINLCHIFDMSRIEPIKAYRNKESFGDMDILVEISELYMPKDIEKALQFNFSPKEIIKNGNVYSFEYKEFQIDIILTPTEEFQSSECYFAYNDLGNLLGRIAHSMGLKLGHDGLSYNWRIENHIYRNIILMTDFKDILPVLGYDYARYERGFSTLEDIFEFVVSSPFFNKDIYLLHNRNNAARVRDRKRKTYTEFLKWIENYEETGLQKSERYEDKREWLPYLFKTIQGFKESYDYVQEEYNEEVKFRELYNGDVVKEITGYSGIELGKFMKWHRAYFSDGMLRKNVLRINPNLFKGWIEYFKDKYEQENM